MSCRERVRSRQRTLRRRLAYFDSYPVEKSDDPNGLEKLEVVNAWIAVERKLDWGPREHILHDYRRILAAPDSDHEDVEISEDLPLDVDVVLLERFEDNSMQVEVLIERDEHPELIADIVEDCPHHVDGECLSTLADLVEDHADLEQDLLEVSALMCDLPESEQELQRYAVDRVAFQNRFCYDGPLTFAFHVADVIVEAYQNFEHELVSG